MGDYYQEILQEIRKLMDEGAYDEAMFTLKKELNMPYIPQDAEKEFLRLRKELAYLRADTRENREETTASLLTKLLHGSAEEQLAAADRLCGRNLRECVKEIKNYLSGAPFMEAAALLIEALAEQEIQEEFTLKRNGLEFTFWADAVTPVEESEGFKEALKRIEEKYSKEPAALQMIRMILVHNVYLYLPLSYESAECETLVEMCEEEYRKLLFNADL